MIEKDKKEIKGYIKELSKDFKRQIGVYVEDVNARFKGLKEGTDGTNEKLDRMEKTLDSHSEQLANVLVDLNGVKIDMEKVSYEVTMHLDKKVDKKHFVNLEGRVRNLEKSK